MHVLIGHFIHVSDLLRYILTKCHFTGLSREAARIAVREMKKVTNQNACIIQCGKKRKKQSSITGAAAPVIIEMNV